MPRPYHHACFRPGLNVYVDPSIRNIHPLSRAAGRIVKVTTGLIYDELDCYKSVEFQARWVPVSLSGGTECELYVEEEYVHAD